MKKKVVINVTEKLYHKIEIELDHQEAKDLIENLSGIHCDEVAGDMTNGRFTAHDGGFELEDYYVSDTGVEK